MTDLHPTAKPHPQARQRRTRWPGWVWLIPLVAIGFAAWLAVEEWVLGPRPLTVHFPSVEGVKPGAPVRFRGVQVGHVERILLDDDLAGARLVLEMSGLRGHLGEGTQVWIERPGFSPGALGSLISGPYLGIAPSGQGEVEALQGLDESPILQPAGPGRTFVLTDEEAGGLAAGAPVQFRGMDVGRVLGRRFGEDGAVEIPVFVEEPHAAQVREATVFWRAGGLAVDTGAGGVDVQLPSLGALGTGAVAFETPRVLEGAPAEADAQFALHPSREDAASTEGGPRLAYQAVFAEPAGDLARGAPVTLARRQIGRVADSSIEVAPDGRGLVTVVRMVVDAERLGVGGLETMRGAADLRERVDTIVGMLVQAGMRARIAEGSIVLGARSVELVMQPGAPPADLLTAEQPPVIPADPSQGVTAAPTEGASPPAPAGEEAPSGPPPGGESALGPGTAASSGR